MKTAIHFLTALLLTMSQTLNAGFSGVGFHAAEPSLEGSSEVLRAVYFTADQPAETVAEFQYQPVTPVRAKCKNTENVVREPLLSRNVNRLVVDSSYIIPSADEHILVFPFHGFW